MIDNLRDQDMRGVTLRRVRSLFLQGQVLAQRITLAHPSQHTLFNTIPLPRTHVLAWIAKS